jgi:hypothetical protein
MSDNPTIRVASEQYTVGRSEGVVYPPDFTLPRLAALYDESAARIAQLEAALREVAPNHPALKP